MKIGLYDVDGHNWPNLCLMKLSTYHKAQGDDVEIWSPEGSYDLVYKSRVFTDSYSKDIQVIPNAAHVICGGPAPTCRTRWSTPVRTTAYIRSFKAPPTAF